METKDQTIARLRRERDEAREGLRKLRTAIKPCIADLEHYVSTHGPGPDKRLDYLSNAMEGLE